MSFPPYECYKDSGLGWLGQIPAHWEIWHSRRMFALRRDRAVEGQRQLTASQKHGVIYQDDYMELEGQKVVQVLTGPEILKQVEPNDFVISMRSFQGGIEWCGLRGSISSAYVMLVPNGPICVRFFAYLFKCKPYIQALQSTSNLVRDGQALRYENFALVHLPVLPFSEQEVIAAFLDREVAKIDALIAEQQRLIELLKEKRQAVISHAVTKGLNPNVKMKDSGFEFLPSVPGHYSVIQLRRIVKRIEQGWSPECMNRHAEGEEWGVLKSGCVNRGRFNDEENKALPESLEPLPDYEVRVGDLLMSRASGSTELIGSMAIVDRTRARLMLSDKIFRFHVNDQIDTRFLMWVLNSTFLRTQIKQAISGADGLANNLPQSSLRQFSIPLPPIDEQREIRDFIGAETARLDALSVEARKAVVFLQERRTALISAAVTGKIDVRGLATTAVERDPHP